MKKFSKSLLYLFLAFPLVFTSCGDDDDNTTTDEGSENTVLNQFSYNGETYDIHTAAIENYGLLGDYYNFDISFTDATGTIDSDGEFTPNETSLTILLFEMFTENPTELSPGTYTYKGQLEANWRAPFTFDASEILFIENFSEELDEEDYIYYEFTDGTVTIAEDSTFEVDFTALDEDGNTISGHYKGETLEFDYTNETGRPATFKTKKRGFLK